MNYNFKEELSSFLTPNGGGDYKIPWFCDYLTKLVISSDKFVENIKILYFFDGSNIGESLYVEYYPKLNEKGEYLIDLPQLYFVTKESFYLVVIKGKLDEGTPITVKGENNLTVPQFPIEVSCRYFTERSYPEIYLRENFSNRFKIVANQRLKSLECNYGNALILPIPTDLEYSLVDYEWKFMYEIELNIGKKNNHTLPLIIQAEDVEGYPISPWLTIIGEYKNKLTFTKDKGAYLHSIF